MRFSVIIPTFNRLESLARCLDTLKPDVQALDAADYEVIVSDDGSQSCEEMIKRQYPWVKWVQGPRLGPAANRNHGAKLAQGDWLVFTDDDCLAVPNWLEAYAALMNTECCALEGAIEPIGKMGAVFAECPINTTGGVFWSANIAVFAKLFDQIGGFDANFPYPAHEDQDLQLRLEKLTAIKFVADAKVFHPIRIPTAGQLLALVGQRCSSWTYLQVKHKRVQGILAYPQLVFGWARSWFPFLCGNIELHSLRGVFVSLMGMFVLGPIAIFRTLYLNPKTKAFSR